MSDDIFDLFRREIDVLHKDHREGLKRIEQQHTATMTAMEAAAKNTHAGIARTSAAALQEVPARIEEAFAIGVAGISEAGQQAQHASATLQEAGWRLQRITRAHLLEHLYLAAIWASGLIVAGFLLAQIYHWAKEPVIEKQNWGCTARWDQKTQICKGEWIKLK